MLRTMMSLFLIADEESDDYNNEDDIHQTVYNEVDDDNDVDNSNDGDESVDDSDYENGYTDLRIKWMDRISNERAYAMTKQAPQDMEISSTATPVQFTNGNKKQALAMDAIAQKRAHNRDLGKVFVGSLYRDPGRERREWQ
ncbi:hypothetical protein ElyMa_004763400 [Elysia marginata]|uniref:Uncharacterized protein n=1 Tax=Elysia marginata TaxID=1093978 RepID=A0AAV4IJ03_9GAST|nr:hypothetical protein ElyMa_004763400 [Elysia marginata]